MGHDIWAYRLPKQEVEERHVLFMDQGPGDFEDYDVLTEECYVSQYRRSAFDPYNKVIYRALSCEELYGGCSGNGDTKTFKLFEIKAALEMLPFIVADKPPKIDPSLAEEAFQQIMSDSSVPADIRAMFPEGGKLPEGVTFERSVPEQINLDIETEFLTEIRDWMLSNDRDSIDIFFG